MRSLIFRSLAGIVAVAFLWAIVIGQRDLTSLCFAVLFAAYAVFGDVVSRALDSWSGRDLDGSKDLK